MAVLTKAQFKKACVQDYSKATLGNGLTVAEREKQITPSCSYGNSVRQLPPNTQPPLPTITHKAASSPSLVAAPENQLNREKKWISLWKDQYLMVGHFSEEDYIKHWWIPDPQDQYFSSSHNYAPATGGTPCHVNTPGHGDCGCAASTGQKNNNKEESKKSYPQPPPRRAGLTLRLDARWEENGGFFAPSRLSFGSLKRATKRSWTRWIPGSIKPIS